MSLLKMLKSSSQNLSKIVPTCVCAMMLALRIVLGIFTNFTLSFAPFVKIGFSFLPIVIVAYLYGPVCAAIVSGAGDILSIVLSNPTSFAIMPGITLCYIIEGFIFGFILYEQSISIKRVSVAFALVLLLCRLPLNTLVLHLIMNIPYNQLLLYRAVILIPFAALEVIISYNILKAINRIPTIKKIK